MCKVWDNNSRIQSKGKTHRENTRIHHAKVAQKFATQKGANPPKSKLSDQSKDTVCEQQNAPRKCNNEYVTTKKQGHSRYVREDPSKITGNTLLWVQTLTARFPPKTSYKCATRRVTSVPQDSLRSCNKTHYIRVFDTSRTCNTTRYMVAIDILLCATTHYDGGVTRRSSRHTTTGELPATLHDTGELPDLHDMGEVPNTLSITTNTLLGVQALSSRFPTALTLRLRVSAAKISGWVEIG